MNSNNRRLIVPFIFGWCCLVTGILSWWSGDPNPIAGAVLATLLFGVPMEIILWKE